MAKKIKSVIARSAVTFTACEMFLLIVAEIMMKNETESNFMLGFLSLRGASLLLFAAFIVNASFLVFDIKALPRPAARMIHYFAIVLCAVVIGVMIPKSFDASFIFVFVVIVTFVYIVAFAISVLVKKLAASKGAEADAYSPVYDEKVK